MIIDAPLASFPLGTFDDSVDALAAVEAADVAAFTGTVPVARTYFLAAGWEKLSDRYYRPDLPNLREQRERRLRWELLRDRSLALLSREQRARVARGEVRSRKATATSRIRP